MPVSVERENLLQEGFIPKFPLPPEPHKNLKLRDAIRLAKDWGCSVKKAGYGDLIIGHPLIPFSRETSARSNIPISPGREDTSQALVSFLRKVRELVVEHPDYLASKPPPKQAVVRPSIRHEKPEAPEPEPVPPAPQAEEPKPAPVQPPSPPVTLTELRNGLHDAAKIDMPQVGLSLRKATRTLGSIAASIHYREHTDHTAFSAFGDCNNPMCIAARAALDSVDRVFGVLSEFRSANTALRTENERLLDELTRPATPAPAPPPPPVLKIEPAKPRTFTARCVDPMIEPTDTPEEKKRKVEIMHMIFMENLSKCWAGSLGTHTRCGKALAMLAATRATPEQMEAGYVNGDFSGWKMAICAMKEPGAGQRLVGTTSATGMSGWATFDLSCRRLREKHAITA